MARSESSNANLITYQPQSLAASVVLSRQTSVEYLPDTVFQARSKHCDSYLASGAPVPVGTFTNTYPIERNCRIAYANAMVATRCAVDARGILTHRVSECPRATQHTNLDAYTDVAQRHHQRTSNCVANRLPHAYTLHTYQARSSLKSRLTWQNTPS